MAESNGHESSLGRVTISVVSHAQAPLCAELMRDLARIRPPSLSKVIYTANLEEAATRFDDYPYPVRIIRNPRPLGFAANHNQAFAQCETDYFAVLNPDLRLERDPFPALIRHLGGPAVGLVAPTILEADGRPADFARALVTPWQVIRRRFVRNIRHDAPEWLAGMFLMLRSDTYRRIGGFDERYRLYCEDADLCARVRLAGMRIEVASEAQVTHLAQRASRRRLRPMLLHVESLMKFWTSPAYRNYRALLREERH